MYLDVVFSLSHVLFSDIPSNVDRDGIAKIEGVPEQVQGTTGPGVPGGVIRISKKMLKSRLKHKVGKGVCVNDATIMLYWWVFFSA